MIWEQYQDQYQYQVSSWYGIDSFMSAWYYHNTDSGDLEKAYSKHDTRYQVIKVVHSHFYKTSYPCPTQDRLSLNKVFSPVSSSTWLLSAKNLQNKIHFMNKGIITDLEIYKIIS